ncbi:MAG: hypothetical protein JWO25_2942 [Alphaproteobacteria bacterium]|nr:hypothetical protein [Alphaproteobacteria bacterium]MDB5720856.1 hypothetical protein [Alphaproteobacteria bacterium]
MRPAYRDSRIIAVLTVLLILSLAANLYLYPRTTKPQVLPEQQALVDRARRHAAAAYGADAAEQARVTYPIVIALSDRTCVELRSTREDRAGNFIACYDPKTGQRLEAHRAAGGF